MSSWEEFGDTGALGEWRQWARTSLRLLGVEIPDDVTDAWMQSRLGLALFEHEQVNDA